MLRACLSVLLHYLLLGSTKWLGVFSSSQIPYGRAPEPFSLSTARWCLFPGACSLTLLFSGRTEAGPPFPRVHLWEGLFFQAHACGQFLVWRREEFFPFGVHLCACVCMHTDLPPCWVSVTVATGWLGKEKPQAKRGRSLGAHMGTCLSRNLTGSVARFLMVRGMVVGDPFPMGRKVAYR